MLFHTSGNGSQSGKWVVEEAGMRGSRKYKGTLCSPCSILL